MKINLYPKLNDPNITLLQNHNIYGIDVVTDNVEKAMSYFLNSFVNHKLSNLPKYAIYNLKAMNQAGFKIIITNFSQTETSRICTLGLLNDDGFAQGYDKEKPEEFADKILSDHKKLLA